MSETFQQFALMDALVGNWDGIRVRMGTLEPRLERELSRLFAELGGATAPDQIAVIIDTLLDVTDGTQASDYVRQLLARADVSTLETNRGVIGERAAESLAGVDLSLAARTLANAAVETAAFLPVPVFFATNRKLHPEASIDGRYGGEYVNEVTYGLAGVTIPIGVHRLGRMERPVLALENRERHVVLDTLEPLDANTFATRLAQRVHDAARRDVLIFLHGYNVTFEEAARRAAQFATDTMFDGVVVLFSWPSAGATIRYFADEDSAAKSAAPLATFLGDLEGGPWNRVHIVAHSMGNRVALAGLASRASLALPLSNVVFVAADVDTGLFEQQFPKLRPGAGNGGHRLTSYATNSDRALWLSRWFHNTNRVGRIAGEPFVTEDLETIDATSVDSSLLGHGYFGQERSVLTDLGLLLREGLPASARQLRRVSKWWAFPA